MRGTYLNTVTVAAGAAVGLLIRHAIPESCRTVVLEGMGLVTLGIGIKIILGGRNIVVIAAAVALGGIIGSLLGINDHLVAFSDWIKHAVGGESTFTVGLVGSSVLFCVGPMTLLGCLQDGIEGKIDLLAIKSTMDGFTAIFMAAAFGSCLLVTALVVLVFQGALTLAARPLRSVASNPEIMDDAAAAGGILLLGTGLNLLSIKAIPVANYLPALFIAPLLVALAAKLPRRVRPDNS